MQLNKDRFPRKSEALSLKYASTDAITTPGQFKQLLSDKVDLNSEDDARVFGLKKKVYRLNYVDPEAIDKLLTVTKFRFKQIGNAARRSFPDDPEFQFTIIRWLQNKLFGLYVDLLQSSIARRRDTPPAKFLRKRKNTNY